MKNQCLLLGVIFVAVAIWAATLTPQPAARDRLVADVYAAVLEKLISTASQPEKIDRLYVFRQTQPAALSKEAFYEVKPGPETARDFVARNSVARPIHPTLSLSRPVEWLAPSLPAGEGNLPLSFSDVGFDHDQTEALVRLGMMEVHEDFLLARALPGEWRVVRVSSAQPL